MPSVSIVIGLNVLEYSRAGLVAGSEPNAMDRLDFQTVEEALGASIVVAVSAAAHAAIQVVSLQ